MSPPGRSVRDRGARILVTTSIWSRHTGRRAKTELYMCVCNSPPALLTLANLVSSSLITHYSLPDERMHASCSLPPLLTMTARYAQYRSHPTLSEV